MNASSGSLFDEYPNPYRMFGPGYTTCSGGRTSGYMLWKMLEAHGGSLPPDVLALFANTGLEEPETYDFLEEMSERWDVQITWVEYARSDGPIVEERGKQFVVGCHGYRIVTPGEASRNGRPFQDLLEVLREYRRVAKGSPAVLPNPAQRLCSAQLKTRTLDRFATDLLGNDHLSVSLGIRNDESHRAKKLIHSLPSRIYPSFPLVADMVTEEEVLKFWKSQPFDLRLPATIGHGTYLGNCGGCFLKSQKKLARIAHERPTSLEWFAQAEEEFGQTFRRDRPSYREIQRGALKHLVVLDDDDEDDEVACACTD